MHVGYVRDCLPTTLYPICDIFVRQLCLHRQQDGSWQGQDGTRQGQGGT